MRTSAPAPTLVPSTACPPRDLRTPLALAAPACQQRDSPAQLAQTFRPLRDGGVDLGVAAVVAPTLNPAPR